MKIIIIVILEKDQYYKSPVKDINCVLSSTLFNHYFFNDTSKAFENCPNECLTCSKESLSDNNKCITCMSNYIYHTLIEGKCVLKCHSGQKWNLDDSNNYFCADNSLLSRKFYISENNQCDENCSKTGTCIYCKNIDKTLYEYENSCVENCPDKYKN